MDLWNKNTRKRTKTKIQRYLCERIRPIYMAIKACCILVFTNDSTFCNGCSIIYPYILSASSQKSYAERDSGFMFSAPGWMYFESIHGLCWVALSFDQWDFLRKLVTREVKTFIAIWLTTSTFNHLSRFRPKWSKWSKYLAFVLHVPIIK